MTWLNYVLAGCTIVSGLGGGTAVFLLRGRWRVDEFTARKLRREFEERSEQLRRERLEADLARADALRRELATLTERNNKQFDENFELRQQLSDLRQEQIELREWANIVAVEMRKRQIEIPPLPAPRAVVRRIAGPDATDMPL